MASAKTASSRSRVHAANGGAKAGSAKENATKLEENLNVFKADSFDADGFVNSKCHTLNEKEIRQLCSYLLDLKKASAEEMRRSVYANYTAFIRTSKEISDLEGELLSMRNLLSTQVTLIHGLAEGVHIDSLSDDDSSISGISKDEMREPSDLEKKLMEFPDLLDVLLAERRINEALDSLDEGERIIYEEKEKKSPSSAVLLALQSAITERRQKLANQLAEAACQPSTRGAELRAAIYALKRLGDGPRAHSLLLNAHYQRYHYNMQTLRPSSTSYGGAYTAALSQLVFSAVAQAASDSMTIFKNEQAYTSELMVWATKQTEDFALLVKRHALASSAAAGGLRAAAECVQIALGHCSLLEEKGLALSPVLLRLFRPSVEQALDANLKRIKESTAALAAADDWELTVAPSSARQSGRSLSSSAGITMGPQHKLSSSAHRFNTMVQDFLEDVGPLLSMQLGGKTLEGLFQVFNEYVSMLVKALPGSMEEEENFEGSGNKIVRIADSESQEMALLANASLLADELLPRAAMKLTPLSQGNSKDDIRRRPSDRQNRHPELREWKKRLMGSVDRLKDGFCRQHALDLIFTEDGDSHLHADMYINMDGNADEIEWSPSAIFQELYAKLNRMTTLATDMFVGRERFATLLFMRLTETVILWLSGDQTFWDDIEEGPRPIGPLGLQQFYLDMKFVMCFASQGRYLSRNLHRVVNEIISRAMTAFAATGMDPNSVLPDDEWFTDVCQEAMERLSGKTKMENGDRELHSPTASVSAQSISSVRSHASS